MFAIGATIKIKETDYVNEKYPNFIGRTAIITATPVHPSNFYKLSLKTTDAEDLKSSSSIELESSAMEFVAISGAASHTESKTALTSENNARPRASSFGQILHCSQAHALKKGVSVTILRTENVVQRCPHLVGQEGVVKEAPVHPATWFKVQFPDGSIFTFRPSALVITSDIPPDSNIDWGVTLKTSSPGTTRMITVGGAEDLEHPHRSRKRNNLFGDESNKASHSNNKRKKPKHFHSDKTERTLESDLEFEETVQFSSINPEKPMPLTELPPESWVGQLVRVKQSCGLHSGVVGNILKSGNGWVQVLTSNGQEIAKRVADLEILCNGRKESQPKLKSCDASKSSTDSAERHSNLGIGSYKKTTAAPSLHIDLSGITDQRYPSNQATSGVFSYTPTDIGGRRPRAYSEPIKSPVSSYYGVPSPKLFFLNSTPRPSTNGRSITPNPNNSKTQSKIDPAVGVIVKQEADVISTSNTKDGADNRDRIDSSNPPEKLNVSEKDESSAPAEPEKKYFIKKVNANLLQARKEFTEKYVSRTQEKIENRPDLTYWKRAITSSIMVDPQYELEVARRSVDDPSSYCPSCGMEKWGGGMFCWNEKCKTSPVYWKLPGARGVPPPKATPILPVNARVHSNSEKDQEQRLQNRVLHDTPVLSPHTTATSFSVMNSYHGVGRTSPIVLEGAGNCAGRQMVFKKQPVVYRGDNCNSNGSKPSPLHVVSLLDRYSDWHGCSVGGDAASKHWGLHGKEGEECDRISGDSSMMNKENNRKECDGAIVRTDLTSDPNGQQDVFFEHYDVLKTPKINPIVTDDMHNRPYTQIIEGNERVDYFKSIVHEDPPRGRTDTHDSTTSEESHEDPTKVYGENETACSSSYLTNDKINHLLYATATVNSGNRSSGEHPPLGSYHRSILHDAN